MTNSKPARNLSTEIVGAIGIPHHDVFAANVGDRVDIGSAQAAFGRLQNPRTACDRNFGGAIRGTVDDEYFSADPGCRDALFAPCNKLADRDFLVKRRHYDREFGIGYIVLRHKQG